MKPNNGAFNEVVPIIGDISSLELPPLMTPVVVRESHNDPELYDWLVAREVAVERIIAGKNQPPEVRAVAELGYSIAVAAVRDRKIKLGLAEPVSESM